MSKYNVVVVGGGPGGSLAAKTAAEKGLKTVLIEKGKWAGAKNSSGCGLGSRWWRDFPDIFEGIHKLPSCRLIKGVEINILDDENEVVTKYTTPHTKEDRKLYTYKGEEVGAKCAAVYRSDLDPYLAELACAAGAELRTAIVAEDVIMKDSQVCGVKLETGEKLDADVVIAADGAYSTMAIRAGMRGRWRKQDITLCPQLDFSCNEEKLDNLYGQYNALWLAPAGGFYQVNFRDGYHLGNGQWFHVWSVKPIDYFKKMLTSPAFIRMCKAVDACSEGISIPHASMDGTSAKNIYGRNVVGWRCWRVPVSSGRGRGLACMHVRSYCGRSCCRRNIKRRFLRSVLE